MSFLGSESESEFTYGGSARIDARGVSWFCQRRAEKGKEKGCIKVNGGYGKLKGQPSSCI